MHCDLRVRRRRYAAMAWVALGAGVACSSASPETTGGISIGQSTATAQTGTMEFHLDVSSDEPATTLELHLECADQSADRVIDVVKGTASAEFGGLTPGNCTVTMISQIPDGGDCARSEQFTVVANQMVDVQVKLVCRGTNESQDIPSCPGTRIRRVYATPSQLMQGDDTTIQVETYPDVLVGAATYSFTLRQHDTDATGMLDAFASCAVGATACEHFTCTGAGASPQLDPGAHLLGSDAWIAVTVQDDQCADTQAVRIPCLQPSACGNGVTEGTEECDDGNSDPNDGCDQCRLSIGSP